MLSDPIVITGFARTPLCSFRGLFSSLAAHELGAASIQAAYTRSKLNKDDVDAVMMGCVLPAGQGQAPARQAALGAQLPERTHCVTVNKMCGSGMEALILAYDSIVAGTNDIVIAGGMESMTNAPYLLDKATAKVSLSEETVNAKALKKQFKDHLFYDGLQDAYDPGKLMGVFAETTAEKYGFTRETQDQYAIESLTRAQKATEVGWFDEEITPITIQTETGSKTITQDEQPLKADINKIPTLNPVFKENGTVTAANASSISDGASALVLMRASTAKAKGLTPIAKITAHASFSGTPAWFTTAPIGAVQKLLEKTQWNLNQVDLFEINEAFAVVTLAAMKELFLPHDKVNVHGGACALGHPIGASGARIVSTLLSALKRYDKTLGIASLCIGGGEATAMAIERI